MKIALLEEQAHYADLMASWLRSAGYVTVVHASDKTFMRDVSRDSYDLLLVGAHAGGTGGAELVIWLREQLSAVIPVMRISENKSEDHVVSVLKAGADDCMIMPLRRAEFLARIEALGRRVPRSPAPAELLNFGDLSVDLKNRVISREGRRVSLTPKSYDLAVFLFSNLGQLLSRGYLMERIWGRGAGTSTRTLDTHISRLRADLSLTPDSGWQLQSVYQHGYRLEQVDLRPTMFNAAGQHNLVAC